MGIIEHALTGGKRKYRIADSQISQDMFKKIDDDEVEALATIAVGVVFHLVGNYKAVKHAGKMDFDAWATRFGKQFTSIFSQDFYNIT